MLAVSFRKFGENQKACPDRTGAGIQVFIQRENDALSAESPGNNINRYEK
jgi:hypothetical protein